MQFADQLRAARAGKRLKQMDVALRAGVSRQTIASLEAGRHLPGLRLAKALAGMLEFSLDDVTL